MGTIANIPPETGSADLLSVAGEACCNGFDENSLRCTAADQRIAQGTNHPISWRSGIGPYADMTASVGDTVTFNYGRGHNVFLHPSGTCEDLGASQIGDNFDSPASFTFSEEGTYTFACEVRRDPCFLHYIQPGATRWL